MIQRSQGTKLKICLITRWWILGTTQDLRFKFISSRSSAMPPKKKQKTCAHTVEDVPAVQVALDQWLQQTYNLRHNKADDGKMALFPWPVEHGGTFLEIAQRAWGDGDRILNGALRVCQKAGICGTESCLDDFQRRFCKMEARCIVLGLR